MTNILFCYWLQGYYEIASAPTLELFHVRLIEKNLATITEPLWPEVQWLKNTCAYCAKLDYKQETLNFILPLLQQCLNASFYHYIDNDKNVDYSIAELDQLHNGVAK